MASLSHGSRYRHSPDVCVCTCGWGCAPVVSSWNMTEAENCEGQTGCEGFGAGVGGAGAAASAAATARARRRTARITGRHSLNPPPRPQDLYRECDILRLCAMGRCGTVRSATAHYRGQVPCVLCGRFTVYIFALHAITAVVSTGITAAVHREHQQRDR